MSLESSTPMFSLNNLLESKCQKQVVTCHKLPANFKLDLCGAVQTSILVLPTSESRISSVQNSAGDITVNYFSSRWRNAREGHRNSTYEEVLNFIYHKECEYTLFGTSGTEYPHELRRCHAGFTLIEAHCGPYCGLHYFHRSH